METLKSIWQRVFLSLLCLTPVALIAGIIDYRFHNYFWPSLDVLRPIEPRFMFDFFSILDIYLVLIFVMYVVGVVAFKLNLPKLKWHWSNAPILLIGGGIIVSYIFFEPVEPRIMSPKLYLSLQYIFPIALFLILSFSLQLRKWRERFLTVLLTSFTVFGIIILIKYFTDSLPGASVDFLHRLVWPYIDPFYDMKPESANWLAFLFGPIVVLAFARAAAGLKRFANTNNILNIISLIVCGLILFLSKSYTGILVTGVLVVWWTFLHMDTKYKKKFIVGLVILAAIGIASQYNTDKFQVMIGNSKGDSSIVQRAQIYNFNWESFKEKPFVGIGPTNYQNYFRLNIGKYLNKEIIEREMPPHAHSLVMSVWSDLGLFGLAAIIAIYIMVANKINLHPKRNYLYFVFAYYLGHGLVDTPYGLEEISILFWLILALAVLQERSNA